MWSLGLLNAGAAEFGPQQVRSAAGQPLRAVIVLGNVSQAEADGLSVKLAGRDAFRQAGLRYDPTLEKLSVSVSPTGGREPGYSGTYLVHVDSAEPINTSFLDLLLVLEWRTGRQSNAVTLSAIPEATAAQPQAVVPAAAPSSAPAPTAAPAQAEQSGASGSAGAGKSAGGTPARAANAANAKPAGASNTSGEGARTVERGDSLSSIAREFTGGEGGTTLAQMMTALFESNRSAFIGNDPNRLRQGATLARPTDAQVQEVPPAQARKFVSAAREQFDAYRARLAESTAQQTAPANSRSAQGAIEAGKAPQAAAPAARDELKLSRPGKGRGAGKAGNGEEEQIAQGKAQTEAQGRVNELQKNVADLQKLLAMKNQAVANLEEQAAAASGASAQDKPANTAKGRDTATAKGAKPAANAANQAAGAAATASGADAASAAAAGSASDAQAQAATASDAAAQAVVASEAAASATQAASAAAAETKPTPNAAMNWRAVRDNPYVLPGAGILVVLLGLWWMMRRRRAEPPVGQDGPYDDGHDGRGTPHDGPQGQPGAEPQLSQGGSTAVGVATGAAVAAGAAGAAAMYAAHQAEADEHLHPTADDTWAEPAEGVAELEAEHADATVAGAALPGEWDAEQEHLTDELAHTAHEASVDAPTAVETASEPEPTAPVVEATSEPEINWDDAFAEQAGEVPAATTTNDEKADASLSALETLGAAAAVGGVAAAAHAGAHAPVEPAIEAEGATDAEAVPQNGVAGMLGDLDLGLPGQPAHVGTIASDALPSLSRGIGSVQFTMAPQEGEANIHAPSGDQGDFDADDGELSDADFDAALQAAATPEASRGYTDAAHDAPSLKPLSFDLSDFSLDLKGDDASATTIAPAFVSAPTLPAATGDEALVEHDAFAQPTPSTGYAPHAAPQALPQTPPLEQVETKMEAPVADEFEAAVAAAAATSASAPTAAPAAVPIANPSQLAELDVPDEFHTKLELAAAYQTIGDDEGARELLEEVIAGGDAAQQSVARTRLAELGK
ncbi:FimV/HubP family polar landmark protein [Pandoraea pneumonica]|uniref:FimV/HubP family polar landmark protein n=1 Tax=Pandoraea pneumonica TaxID=2508299 RepID=UPI003CF933D6